MANISTTKIFNHPIAQAYFDKISAAGGDVADKNGVSNFVEELSKIVHPSLWVCWPLRSSQNIGTGSTVYSLGGLGNFNGAMVNGPTWGSEGMLFTQGTNSYISTSLSIGIRGASVAVFKKETAGSSTSVSIWGQPVNTSAGFPIVYGNNGSQGNSITQYTTSPTTAHAAPTSTGPPTLGARILSAVSWNPTQAKGWSTYKSSFAQEGPTSYSNGPYTLEYGSMMNNIILCNTNGGSGLFSDITFSFILMLSTELTSLQAMMLLSFYKKYLGAGLALP